MIIILNENRYRLRYALKCIYHEWYIADVYNNSIFSIPANHLSLSSKFKYYITGYNNMITEYENQYLYYDLKGNKYYLDQIELINNYIIERGNI